MFQCSSTSASTSTSKVLVRAFLACPTQDLSAVRASPMDASSGVPFAAGKATGGVASNRSKEFVVVEVPYFVPVYHGALQCGVNCREATLSTSAQMHDDIAALRSAIADSELGLSAVRAEVQQCAKLNALEGLCASICDSVVAEAVLAKFAAVAEAVQELADVRKEFVGLKTSFDLKNLQHDAFQELSRAELAELKADVDLLDVKTLQHDVGVLMEWHRKKEQKLPRTGNGCDQMPHGVVHDGSGGGGADDPPDWLRCKVCGANKPALVQWFTHAQMHRRGAGGSCCRECQKLGRW